MFLYPESTRSIRSAAWAEFKAHITRNGILASVFVALLGPGFYWWAEGTSDAKEQVGGWVLSGIAPLGALVLWTVVRSFYLAPYLIVDERLRGIEKKIDAPPAQASVVVQRGPMSDLELVAKTTADREKSVRRGNLQSIADELATARDVLDSALLSERWWRTPIETRFWTNTRTGLTHTEGFHDAYEALRDTYKSIDLVEESRDRWAEKGITDIEWADREVIRACLGRVENAKSLVGAFLRGGPSGG